MKERLVALLYPIRKRLIISRLIAEFLTGLFWSFVIGALLRFFVAPFYLYVLMGLILIFPLVRALFCFPGYMDAARTVDEHGLKERCRTALEFLEEDSDIANRQREDTVRLLAEVEPARVVRIMPKRRALLKALSGLMIFTVLFFVHPLSSGGTGESFAPDEKVVQEVSELLEELKQVKGISGKRLKELEEILKELEVRLSQARDSEEVEAALAEAATSLRRLSQESTSSADVAFLEEISQALSEMEAGADYSLSELYRLANKAASVCPELAELLRDAAGELALEQGKAEDLISQARAKSEALLEEAQAAELAGKYAARLGMLGSTALASNTQGASSGGGSGQSESGNGPGFQGGGDSGGQGSGSGKSGSGGESQSGTQGSGAGTGHSPGNDESGSAGAGGGSSSPTSASTQDIGEYEPIYAPEHLGGEGEESYLPGTSGEASGGEVVDYIYGPGDVGSLRPYNEVIVDYAQAARESLARSVIPPGVQDIVWQYFTSLDEGLGRDNW